MSLASLLSRVPLYWSFRAVGRPRLLPFSLVVSATYRCNSRCRTCNVWQKHADELTVDEWGRVFAGVGRGLYYLTFTGGEPFLRRELPELARLAWQHCRPAVITIPTNGLLTERIPGAVEEILRAAPGSKLGVNVSLDGVGAQHDEIRGAPGGWDRALATFRALKAMEHPNLTVSIHTVVSRYNVDDMPAIIDALEALGPDSYITEVAEQRVELGTVGADITPSVEAYGRAVDVLSDRLQRQHFTGISRVTQAFRAQYYGMARRVLAEQRQVIPCYAGWGSGHISPEGDVWTCCIRAEPIGNLREEQYDFRRIWFGPRAEALRRDIRAGGCHCPMANAGYANMFLHLPSLLRAAVKMLR